MTGLQLHAIAPTAAARALDGLHQLDPRGIMGAGDVEPMCERGQCYMVTGPDQLRAVYVVRLVNGVAWVDAAAGTAPGADLSAVLDAVITAQASGLRHIAMQTGRPGLVRKLRGRGWRVAGWIMRKDLQCSPN